MRNFTTQDTKDRVRQIWRKALAEGGMEVLCPTRGLAEKTRWMLYNATRDVAKRPEAFDTALVEAREKLAAVIVGSDVLGWKVVIRPKQDAEALELLELAAGMEPTKVGQRAEAEAEGMAGMLERLQQAQPEAEDPDAEIPATHVYHYPLRNRNND